MPMVPEGDSHDGSRRHRIPQLRFFHLGVASYNLPMGCPAGERAYTHQMHSHLSSDMETTNARKRIS
jgi:hypothetical protein